MVTYLNTMHVNNVISFPKIHLISSSDDYRNIAIKFLTTGGDSYRKVAPLLVLGQQKVRLYIIWHLKCLLFICLLFQVFIFHYSL